MFSSKTQRPSRRRLYLILLGILLSLGINGCVNFKVGAISETPQQSHTHIPSTSTATPTVTITDTALPSATTTVLPATQTATLQPSATTKLSATALSQPFVIGYSIAERPLEVFHFGSGPINRMIIAGIHGGYEWNTIALAEQLIEYLTKNPDALADEITLYILRSANPDGEARGNGSSGRANENGVDINRNFPANWARDWDKRGCWNHLPITAGAYAGSEPETGAIMKFALTNQIDALINYHSAALGIFAGGVTLHSKSHDLAQTLAAVAPYTYPPPYETGCDYTGQLTNWAANHNIAAVDIELTNHEDTDFDINLKILTVFLNWDAK